MSKVPVGGSIAHAYEFLFGRFFQVIGTAWLPAVIGGVGYYALIQNQAAWLPAHLADGAQAMQNGMKFGVLLAVAAFFLLVRSVLNISLTQEALGVRKDLTLAHFVVGTRELRLFFGYVRYELVFFALYALVIAAAASAMYAATHYGTKLAPGFALAGKPLAVAGAALFGALIAIWFALSMLRLVFLLAPVASAEHRTRLGRAWQISRGSTLRIFIVLVATFLPVALGSCAALYYLLSPADISALIKALQKLAPSDHEAAPALINGFIAAHALVLAEFSVVMTIVASTLLAGASAHAYRAVTGHEDPELEDDAALVAPLLVPVAEHHPAPAEEEPLPAAPEHGHDHNHGHDHGGHGDHGHGGHEDHGHGGDHGHNGDRDHGNHGDHAAPEEDSHADHGHDDHGKEGHGDHGHGDHHAESHDSHGGHGHADHGHGGDHGHGHDGHHARAA